MSKRHIYHHQPLWQLSLVGILLALALGLPLMYAFFYGYLGRLPNQDDLGFVVFVLALLGFSRGAMSWLKNKP